MLHLIFATLLSDAAAGAYQPIAMKPSEFFARATEARGKRRTGTYELHYTTQGGGLTSTRREIENGTNYDDEYDYGPFHTSSGSSDGQSWHENANGVVTMLSGFHSRLDTPWDRAFRQPDDPKSGVRILGTTTDEPHRIVLEIHPQGEQDQFRYYDARTYLLQEVITYTKTGDKQIVDYSDYRTMHGETLPFRTRYTDGSAVDERETVLDSFVQDPDGRVPGIPVPKQLFALPGNAPVTLPAHFTEHGIIIEASANGKPVNFVLDSGASSLVIDPGTAHAAGAKSFGRANVDIGGRVGESQTMIDSLDIGALHVQNVAFTELPFDRDSSAGQVSGLLGYDFLASTVVEVDFKAHTVTLLPRGSFDPQALGLVQPDTELDDGVPRVKLTCEDVPGYFILDTGSFVTMFYRNYIDKLPSAPMVQSDDSHFIAIGGENSAEYRALSDLIFGGIHFRAAYAYMPKTADFQPYGYDGLLGRDVLAHYQVFFDYPDGAVYVKPTGT